LKVHLTSQFDTVWTLQVRAMSQIRNRFWCWCLHKSSSCANFHTNIYFHKFPLVYATDSDNSRSCCSCPLWPRTLAEESCSETLPAGSRAVKFLLHRYVPEFMPFILRFPGSQPISFASQHLKQLEEREWVVELVFVQQPVVLTPLSCPATGYARSPMAFASFSSFKQTSRRTLKQFTLCAGYFRIQYNPLDAT
jgi:hypothetical protein